MSSTMTKEAAFQKKLEELGLRAVLRESEREARGVIQRRLEIRIFHKNNDKELCFTTGGFYSGTSYRESGFEQGLRRLIPIEAELQRQPKG